LQVCQQTGYLLPGCAIRFELGGGAAVYHAVPERHALVDNDRRNLADLLDYRFSRLGGHARADRRCVQDNHSWLVCRHAKVQRGRDGGDVERRRTAGEGYQVRRSRRLKRGMVRMRRRVDHNQVEALALTGLSVICVQKVPLRKVGKINEIALRAEVISLI
jgi:hypothetical protein